MDKPALYDAIIESFRTPLTGQWKIPIATYTNFNTSDKFILTQQQPDQLRNNENTFGISSMVISGFPEQLMLYVNYCMGKPTLLRILAGDNPE